MSKPSDLSVHERIRQEHEELRQLISYVHKMLAERRDAMADVAAVMHLLQGHLHTHFNEEETAGFFDDIVSQAPRLADRVAAVKNEHPRMDVELQELIAGIEGSPSGDTWQRLEEEFHNFSKRLMQHETEEHRLLLEAYGDDLGAAD